MAGLLDPVSPIPLYHQLRELLRGEIDAGTWDEGEFPTEQELCHLHSISRATVRQALTGLVQEGLLMRKQGRGTMVVQRKVRRNLSEFVSFTTDMETQGLVPSVKVVLVQTIGAQAGLAHHLNIAVGEPTVEVTRIRYVNGEPLVVETRYFPCRWFPGIESEDFTRPRVSEIAQDRYGIPIAEEERYVEPGLADPFEAKSLDVAAGSPILRMERVFRNDAGTAVSMSVWVVRGDRCRYYIRILSPLLSPSRP